MESVSPAPNPQAPAATVFSHRAILAIYSGLMLGMLLAALDQTIVSTALPTIVGELGGLDHLSWVVTAYLLTSTISVPLYGKLSDLYGRRQLFQGAIVLFLIGSVLAGLSRSMIQLIVFRGLQGLGGGGLFAMALTVIGDVVPPRQRGRYQGYMGAVFAFSSIAGPYMGGFFVDNLSWRWIFYINVPFGVAALVVTSVYLKLPVRKIRHRIDFEGAGLLVAGTSAILLALVWGGNKYAWGSPQILALGAAGLVGGILFVLQEKRAKEPILPMRLFRNSIFTVALLLSVVIGFSMFGSTIWLPMYLQGVQGVSASQSGQLMIPLMMGIVVTSIVSGRVITKTGRYKIWPIVGTAVTAVGLFLFSTMDASTSRWLSSGYMILVGAGMGMFMQVLILAVQNAVDQRDLGVATSGVNFIRSLGGTFGVAISGSIFTSTLKDYLRLHLPSGGGGAVPTSQLLSTPERIHSLPAELRDPIVAGIAQAVHVVFLVVAPIAALGFVLALFLKELPLRETQHPGGAVEKAGQELAATFETAVPEGGGPRLARRPPARREVPRIPPKRPA